LASGPPHRPRPPGARAGFTLIELMAIAVLLGLMGTVGYVTWVSMTPRAELNEAVRELAATLGSVRSDAITRSQVFQIEYDFLGDEERGPGYRVVTPYRLGGGLAEQDDERVTLSWKTLPESVRFRQITVEGEVYADDRLMVAFDPLGSSVTQLILLEQPKYGNLYTIEVLGLTGMFRLHEGEYERDLPDDNDFM